MKASAVLGLVATAVTTVSVKAADFVSIGTGHCRTDTTDCHPPWGYVSSSTAQQECSDEPSCVGFYEWSAGEYQIFCSETNTMCTNGGACGATDINTVGHGDGTCFKKSTPSQVECNTEAPPIINGATVDCTDAKTNAQTCNVAPSQGFSCAGVTVTCDAAQLEYVTTGLCTRTCTTQGVGCAQDGTECLASGDTSKLQCAIAASGYNVDTDGLVAVGDAPGTCNGNEDGSQVCTCGVGLHGTDTLAPGESFRGCFTDSTSFQDWFIDIKDDANTGGDSVLYDETTSKITVRFEKSGGRAHRVQLFKSDCITTSTDGLLALGDGDILPAGVAIDTQNEYLDAVISVDMTVAVGDSTYYDEDSKKVKFCVRADVGLGVDSGSGDSVNFKELQLSFDIALTADFSQIVTNLVREGPDTREFNIAEAFTLDACQCLTNDVLVVTDRCGNKMIDTTLKQSDLLGLCVSTQNDDVYIEQIKELKLAQGSNTFDVIDTSGTTSALASYDGQDRATGHIHRVKTQLLSKFFEKGTPSAIAITGKAHLVYKTTGARRLTDVVIKRALEEEGQEADSEFSLNVELERDEEDGDISASPAVISAIPLATVAALGFWSH